MIIGRKLERGIDIVGELLAFFTVALVVLLCINNIIPKAFLLSNISEILNKIAYFAMFIVVGLKGLEFALKRNFFIFLIYALLVAAGVIMLFFPGAIPSVIKSPL